MQRKLVALPGVREMQSSVSVDVVKGTSALPIQAQPLVSGIAARITRATTFFYPMRSEVYSPGLAGKMTVLSPFRKTRWCICA